MQRPQLYVKPNLFVEAKARTTEMPSLRKRLLIFRNADCFPDPDFGGVGEQPYRRGDMKMRS